MAVHENSLKNLLPPLQKGHPPCGGRPKGSGSIVSSLKKLLREDIKKFKIDETTTKLVKHLKLKSVADALALKMVLLGFASKSQQTSLNAIKEAIDRLEGTALQNINLITKKNDITELTEEQLRAVAEGRADFSDVIEPAESLGGTDAEGEAETETTEQKAD